MTIEVLINILLSDLLYLRRVFYYLYIVTLNYLKMH